MPDLGPYAIEVGLAYGVSLALIGGLVWLSWRRDRAARHELDRVERGRDGTD